MITTTNREYVEGVFGLFEVQSFAHLGAQCLSHAMEYVSPLSDACVLSVTRSSDEKSGNKPE